MRLAGTYHPIPYLLERISEFLPGVTVISAVWLDFDRKLYSSNEAIPLNEYHKVKAQSIRNTQLSSEWSNNSDLFSTVKNKSSQLSLEDEDALNVLKLFFPSPVDDFKDAVLIAFPQNVFLKSLNSKFKGISTQEKRILSNMLISVLTADHQKVLEEKPFLKSVEAINRKKDVKIKQLTEDLKSTEQLYSSAIRNIINDFKIKFEKQLNKSFVIQNQVIFKLAKERLSFSNIEAVLKNAIYLAYNLNISEDTIQITTDHIQLDNVQKEKIKPVNPATSNNGKTAVLLDNYEKAALQAESLGLAVNGKNVAAHLDPPVTPPAITDAVKKNNSKISYLLRQYPEKWTNIRKAIRPIANLDNGVINNAS